MIRNVTVHPYKVRLGGGESAHREWANFITGLLRNKIGDLFDGNIDVYNMLGGTYEYNAGSESRIVIYGHASRSGAEQGKVRGDGIVLKDANGIEVAEYFKDVRELYIPSNIFSIYSQENMSAFETIINAWKEQYFDKLALEHSWIHTSNKDELSKRFKERVERALKESINYDKRDAEGLANNIEDYKRRIKQSYDNMIRLRNKIERDEASLGGASSQLLKDLDLIVNHPAISDLHIKDGKFIIFIPNIHAYDDEDNRYYLGNFKVEIIIENTDVRFYGDNPRRSYWSTNDPHPHVNGANGQACLGNVSSTIAELCSRNEIYALALVCIDFLESVNTDDPAGRNVVNWDMVDDEGNIIQEGGTVDPDEEEFEYHCEDCGVGIHEGDDHYVYEDAHLDETGEVVVSNGRTVCDRCRDSYSWCEEAEEYINDNSSVWGAIEDRDNEEDGEF